MQRTLPCGTHHLLLFPGAHGTLWKTGRDYHLSTSRWPSKAVWGAGVDLEVVGAIQDPQQQGKGKEGEVMPDTQPTTDAPTLGTLVFELCCSVWLHWGGAMPAGWLI